MIQLNGRELKDMGCPQNKIKFFVNKEFESLEILKRAIEEHKSTPSKSDEEREIDLIVRDDVDCAFQVLWELGIFPGAGCLVPCKASKRELRQWLDDGAIRVNGKFPKAHEHIFFPITDLCFFPGSKCQTTLM